MKIKSIIMGCGLICAQAFILPVTYAETGDKYIGISVGTSDDDILDDTDTGIKLIFGYQASDVVELEVAYVDLGDFDLSPGSLSQSGIALNVIGKLPVNSDVAITGKFGMYSWDADAGFGSDTGTDIAYGFGVDVKISKKISLVAEYEMFDVADGDVSLFSAGAKFYFY